MFGVIVALIAKTQKCFRGFEMAKVLRATKNVKTYTVLAVKPLKAS